MPVDSIIGIPTSMTAKETEALQTLCAGRKVLEIGSLLGYSTIAIAQVAREVWAIDPHDGYPLSDPKPTLAGFIDNIERHGVKDKIITIVANAQLVLPTLKGHFDVIFIDITRHAKELIFKANYMEPQYIAVHDYGHPVWTGATEAIQAFNELSRCPMTVTDTLAILHVSACREGY